MIMESDIVAYWWTEAPGTKKQDIIRLGDIRLYVATIRSGTPHINAMVPVLMDDGRSPYIILSTDPVYKLTKAGRYGKMFIGTPTEEERSFVQTVPGLYCGNPEHDPTMSMVFANVVNRTKDMKVGPFNAPMWCRKARSRKDLKPRNNPAIRSELNITTTNKHHQARDIKEAWDAMAENAYCVGYCTDGLLFDADMIRSGGVVCVPRQYQQSLDICGVCLKSDMLHTVKTQKWKGCKL